MTTAGWQLDVFFGDSNPAEARVYAQLSGTELADLTVDGTVRGPESLVARTLPATARFRTLPPGATLLAEAVIPDPCFWTPDAPFLYAVDLTVRRGHEAIESHHQLLGIRRLATSGKKLLFDARRWVLRGVVRDEIREAELAEWNAAGAAMIATNPDEALCEAASRQGVLNVAKIAAPPAAIATELRRLAKWPAVAMAIVDHGVDESSLGERPPRHLLIGERFARGEACHASAWAKVVLCETADPADVSARTAGCEVPVIVIQSHSTWPSLEAARAGCDRLQRDLAAYGDFAGYCV
jgi:hypothetical protein